MEDLVFDVQSVSHRYGQAVALDEVSFQVPRGSMFGFLGPNGSGKSTLFGVLSSLLPVQSGAVRALGIDLSGNLLEYRRQIGVAFQSPSLDRRLTVMENLVCHGQLFGLSGPSLKSRIKELCERFRVWDRAADRVEVLSGGLRRRVELAKCLIHRPQVLLLDEPSSGLDPGARREFWDSVEELRQQDGITVVVATHLMDEAERCDRLVLLNRGKVAADDRAQVLKQKISGETLTIQADRLDELKRKLSSDLGLECHRHGDALRLHCSDGHQLLAQIMDRYRADVRSISLSAPTLEDVYFAVTGQDFSDVK